MATPQADQFLRSVWPTDIPWQDEDQLVPLLKANQPFSCPIEGCNHTVTNKTELLRHLRLAHTKLELKRALEGERPDDEPHTQFVGAYVMVPPFRPPVQAPVPVCPYHDKFRLRCPLCKEVKEFAKKGPSVPLKFYKMVKVSVPNVRHSCLILPNTFTATMATATTPQPLPPPPPPQFRAHVQPWPPTTLRPLNATLCRSRTL